MNETFAEYKKRITEYHLYQVSDRKDLIINLLWEILEMLWPVKGVSNVDDGPVWGIWSNTGQAWCVYGGGEIISSPHRRVLLAQRLATCPDDWVVCLIGADGQPIFE